MDRISWIGPVAAFGLASILLGCGGGALNLEHQRNGRVLLVASTTDNKIQTFRIGGGDLKEIEKDDPSSDSGTDSGTTSSTGTVIGGIKTTQEPTLGMAVSNEHLYTSTADGKIEQYRIMRSGELEGMSPSSVPLQDGLGGIVASVDGKWLFASGNLNKIYQYVIGSDSKLTPNAQASVDAGDHPVDLQVSPNGLHLYAANKTDGTISQFNIASDGTLHAMSPAVASAPSGPYTMAINKAGTYLYAACADTSEIAIYHIESDGRLTHVNNATGALNAESMAIEPIDGIFAFSGSVEGSNQIKRYTVGAGALSELTPAKSTDHDEQKRLAFSPEGNLYVSDSDDKRISGYRCHEDGTLSLINTVSTIDDPGPIVFRYLP